MRLVIGLFLAAIGGCGPSVYNVGVLNATGQELDDVTSHVGRYEATHGFVGPDIEEVWGDLPHPVPARVTVTWRSADGASHEQSIEIPAALRRFNGTLYFRLERGGRIGLVALPREGIESLSDPWRARPVVVSGPAP